MSDVTLSSAVRNNLLSLQSTADLMSKTQERLATGLKVNSALDNPTNFFNASALNSRAGDLGRLLDGVSNATQTLEAADNGIEAITKLVESAQATARQALQTPGTVETAASVDGAALANDTAAVATGTTGLTGSNASDSIFTAGDTVTIDIGGTARTYELVANGGAASGGTDLAIELESDGSGTDVDIDTVLAAIQTDLQANVDSDATVALDSGTITVNTVGVGSGDLTITDNTTGDQFGGNATATDTNAALAASSDSFTVQFGTAAASTVDLSSVNSVEQLTTALSSVSGVTYDATDGRVEVTASNTDDSIVIAGTGAAAAGLTAATTAPTSEVNTERGEFVAQYNELMGQIDELAEDAGFNGVNLLNGDDLSVIFNEDGSSTLSITGVSYDASGLGLGELASTGLDTDASINSTLDTLDTAISSLRSQASEFGSNLSIVETREDFTKSMINTLETGAANLTLADTNEEGANLLALQTRQSLSSTSLSLASQADQNVLRLL
ncbi:MAG: flagellin [Pseudomonadota bacterium]